METLTIEGRAGTFIDLDENLKLKIKHQGMERFVRMARGRGFRSKKRLKRLSPQDVIALFIQFKNHRCQC